MGACLPPDNTTVLASLRQIVATAGEDIVALAATMTEPTLTNARQHHSTVPTNQADAMRSKSTLWPDSLDSPR